MHWSPQPHMAAYLLDGGKTFVFSHQFVRIPLAQGIALINDQPLTARLDSDGLCTATSLDYKYRPRELESQSWWNFMQNFKSVPITKKVRRVDEEVEKDSTHSTSSEGVSDESEDDPVDEECAKSTEKVAPSPPMHRAKPLLFLSGHPRAAKIKLIKCKHPRVPSMSGKRLPDLSVLISNQDADDSDGKLYLNRERYAQSVLLMFVPWRSKTDLLIDTHDTSWWDALMRIGGGEALSNLTNDARNILRNMQAYFDTESSFNADTTEGEGASKRHSHGMKSDESESDGNNEDDTDIVAYALADELDKMAQAKKEQDDVIVAGFKNLGISVGVPVVKECDYVEDGTTQDGQKYKDAVSKLKQWSAMFQVNPEDEGQLDNNSATNTEGDTTNMEPTVPTQVMFVRIQTSLADCMHTISSGADTLEQKDEEDEEAQKRDGPPLAPANRPSIADQSKHWTLNHKQHLGFMLLAAAILDRLLYRMMATDEADRFHMEMSAAREALRNILAGKDSDGTCLHMYLCGSGGTGKSRVINATIDYARRWEALDILCVTACSGIAGTIIGGFTYQSAMGISRNTTACLKRQPDPALMAAWQPVGLLIIDEISMMSRQNLYTINERLKQLKDCDTLFGGIHVLFGGDLYQLAGRGNLPSLCVDPSLIKKEPNFQDVEGYRLWTTALNACVELLDNRRVSDPVFKETLERFRINAPTVQDITYINKRVMSKAKIPPPQAPIAVATNKSRAAVNSYCFNEWLNHHPIPFLEAAAPHAWRNRGALLIFASLSKARGSGPIQVEHVNYIRAAVYKEFVGSLGLILGGPVIVTHNYGTRKGIANGTSATLFDVQLTEEAVVRFLPLEGAAVGVHFVEAKEVRCLILKHKSKKWRTRTDFAPFLPKGCFPVITRSTSKQMDWGVSRRGKRFSVNMEQFWVLPRSASTGHKLQGQSEDFLVTAPWYSPWKFGNNGWLYVVLSRATSPEGLFLSEPLPTLMKGYKKRTTVMNEMMRLREVEKSTVLAIGQYEDQETNSNRQKRSDINMPLPVSATPFDGSLISIERRRLVAERLESGKKIAQSKLPVILQRPLTQCVTLSSVQQPLIVPPRQLRRRPKQLWNNGSYACFLNVCLAVGSILRHLAGRSLPDKRLLTPVAQHFFSIVAQPWTQSSNGFAQQNASRQLYRQTLAFKFFEGHGKTGEFGNPIDVWSALIQNRFNAGLNPPTQLLQLELPSLEQLRVTAEFCMLPYLDSRTCPSCHFHTDKWNYNTLAVDPATMIERKVDCNRSLQEAVQAVVHIRTNDRFCRRVCMTENNEPFSCPAKLERHLIAHPSQFFPVQMHCVGVGGAKAGCSPRFQSSICLDFPNHGKVTYRVIAIIRHREDHIHFMVKLYDGLNWYYYDDLINNSCAIPISPPTTFEDQDYIIFFQRINTE